MFLVLIEILLIGRSFQSCSMEKKNHTLVKGGEPNALDAKGRKIFEKLCQPLFDQYTNKTQIETCCNTDQLEEFETQVKELDSIVPGCHVCRQNIYTLTCNMICHRNQSLFTYPIIEDETVKQLKIALSFKMADSIFDSCKDVILPGTTYKVILMLCSGMPGKCNPVNMLKSILSYSPLHINTSFYHDNKSLPIIFHKILDEPTMLCNASYIGSSLNVSSCSCQDCLPACPLPFLPIEIVSKIANLTYYQFFIILIYILVLLLLIFIYVYKKYKNRYHSILYDSNPLPDVDDQFGIETRDPLSLNFETVNVTYQGKILASVEIILVKWALFMATHKLIVIALSVVFIGFLSCGTAFHFKIMSDPIEIWSPEKDEFRLQKKYFDSKFGPFYRTEQIIISAPTLKTFYYNIDGEDILWGPVFNKTIIQKLFNMHSAILNLSIEFEENKVNKTYKLADFCLKPTAPLKNECAMFSITQYFQNDIVHFKKGTDSQWLLHVDSCIENELQTRDPAFYSIPCLADFGGSIDPKLIFGGFTKNPREASAFVITYTVNNNISNSLNGPIRKWEKKLIEVLMTSKDPLLEISFSTERSIQDEIDRQSRSEARSVAASYIFMFVYVSLALGHFSFDVRTFLIKRKFVLGFCGVLIVFLSVFSAIGFFCYLRFDVNLIVLEVLPFLALAIGVDNIFLLVNQYKNYHMQIRAATPVPIVVAEVFGSVGQGMIVSATLQVSTFLIGSISNIPAVKCFCLFAAMTIFINFLLQVTLFLAIFTLDAIRESSGRYDIFCCIQISDYEPQYGMGLLDFAFQIFSKFLFSRIVRKITIVFFVTIWFASIFIIPSIPVGLDQTDALPSDSYLTTYFSDLFNKLKAGPPLYFMVAPGFPYENSTARNKLCSGTTCDKNSLTNIVNQFSLIPEQSKIATSSFSWVDAYSTWLTTSDTMVCCSYFKNHSEMFCPSYLRNETLCTPCFSNDNFNITSEIWAKYLPWFLADVPTHKCPFGGKPLYSRLVILNEAYYKNKSQKNPVLESAFLTFHTSLVKSEDFKTALSRVLYIANNISTQISHKVTPYSIFYVYYGAYLTLWKEFSICFTLAFVIVSVVHFIMYLFSLRMVIIMTSLTFLMSAVDMGFMYMVGINLNPVSLVNLIMLIGINIEFLSHIGRAYMLNKTPLLTERAQIVFVETGPSILSGITLTKFVGIIVLGTSKSKLFQLYYFKMYLGAILVGAAHGLLILPILLHYFGPQIKHSSAEQDAQEIISTQ